MRLLTWLRNISISLLALVAPARETEKLVAALTPTQLRALQKGPSSLGLLSYDTKEVAALVWEVKYYANARAVALACVFLEEAVLTVCEETLGTPLLVPIPSHPRRLRARGHSQTRLMCDAVAHSLGDNVEYMPEALKKVRDTRPQQGLSREKRLHNVLHSMKASPDVSGRVCIVLDDVATTGATMEEATRALKEAGASDVLPIALASV